MFKRLKSTIENMDILGNDIADVRVRGGENAIEGERRVTLASWRVLKV